MSVKKKKGGCCDMKKTTIFLIMLCVIIVFVAGCIRFGGVEDSSDASKMENEYEGYPLKSDVTLTYWMGLNPTVSSHSISVGDTIFAKNLEEKTGVKIKYIHPPSSGVSEAFSTMIASGNLPDIIGYRWATFPGGPDNAISQGIIRKLNQLIDKYSPNFKKLLEDDPNLLIATKTDMGNLYGYPFIREDEIALTFFGGMIRGDWLEELNLDPPETIDEWETTLKAFKDSKGIEVPLTFSMEEYRFGLSSAFLNAFGAASEFYLDDGKVKYGPYEPAYNDFIKLMSRWYKEGLFDYDFANQASDRINSMVINGQIGAMFGFCGSDFGMIIPAAKERNPSFKMVPVKYPVLVKGQKPEIAQRDWQVTDDTVVISATSKHPELAARFLDYGYSKDGNLYYNFGTEGLSYTMINGVPEFTDIVLNKEKNGGLSVSQAVSKYARSSYGGPFIQSKDYILQVFSLPEQKNALSTWAYNNMKEHKMPMVSLSLDENKEVTTIMQDIKTFVKEWTYKSIMGVDASIKDYGDYLTKLESVGIERVLNIYQTAYERYMSRK